MEKGYIHLYSGNGKGKTTAAIGLTIRAAGAGKRILFAQFVKGLPYSEHQALERFDEIDLRIFGRECFIEKDPEPEDIEAAVFGFEYIKRELQRDAYDIIVLDELNIALHFHLLDSEEVIQSVAARKTKAEIIITGRYPPQGIIDLVDLHTEMKEVRHYYNSGIEARKGIEF